VNFIISGGDVSIDVYGAIFNSTLLRWVYEGYFGALRMSGGFMQVQAPQLRVLPLPHNFLDSESGEMSASVERLAEFGRQRREVEQQRIADCIVFMSDLLADLNLARRRDDEPSWVLPRQAALLAAIENPAATDLEDFWRALRLTTRQLRIELTPQREARILELVQRTRPRLLDYARRRSQLESEIDEIVFECYGLTDREIERVHNSTQ
jgi:hypothetical protein